MDRTLEMRGFLLHLSHYDPLWNKEGWRERMPFDMTLGLDIIDEMAKAGLNTLVVDCEDAVAFKSHPELARPYTMSAGSFKKLADHAKARGLEVIPKLNFSQSAFYCHNDWMRPYNKWDDKTDLFDSEEYWRIAFELIDDIASLCAPKRFHVGMDEDTERSHRLFAKAIDTLDAGLAKRGMRTVIWRDSRTDPRGEAFTEKHIAAERGMSRRVIPAIWRYERTADPEIVRSIVKNGFELWGATGESAPPELVSAWRDLLLENGGTGLLLTKWIPCHETNRQTLLDFIRRLGPATR